MKRFLSKFFVCVISIFMVSQISFATSSLAPGSDGPNMDFSNVTQGLYYNGADFYFLLDTGIYATNFMFNMEGDRFYFGEDGKMVKEEVVEHEGQFYYFDANGAMVKNRWITIETVDPYDGTVEMTTYYFGPSGRAYRAPDGQGVLIKEIDGSRYGFNIDGERLERYVNSQGEELEPDTESAYAECMYYFDPYENFAATTGWHLYTDSKDEAIYDPEDEMYLYFDEKTCRKVYSKDPNKMLKRTIDGQRYMFNSDGVRFYEWYGVSTVSQARPKYFSEDYDGFLAKGWFMAVPSENCRLDVNKQYHTDQEEQWFYADSTGKIVRSCIKKIGKYVYAFDEDGVMQSDALVVVQNGQYVKAYRCEDITREQVLYGNSEGGILTDGQKWMYFRYPENDEALVGSMAPTNKIVNVSLKDDDISFCANNVGGYSNSVVTDVFERSGKYYQNGVLLKPLDENKYGVVRTTKTPYTEDGGNYYYYAVVDHAGTIKTTYGCLNDNKNKCFVLTRANGEFLGVYSCKAQYVASTGRWRHQIDNEWRDGFPPEQYNITSKDFFLNFKNYEDGIGDVYAAKYR